MLLWILGAILVLAAARTILEVQFLKRALHAFSNGQPSEALEWVRRAEVLAIASHLNPIAYQVKGLALAARGEHEAAAIAYAKSAERARATGQGATLGRSLVLLATIDRRQGELGRAEARAREAATLDPRCRRDALLCLAECGLARGTFDEARAHLKEARAAVPIAQEKLERMSQATIALCLAWLEGEATRWEAAERALDDATAGATDHPKLVLFCEATRAWFLAANGHTAKAMIAVRALDDARSRFADDVEVQLTVLSLQARAATQASAFAEGRKYGEEYLALPLARCFVPRAQVLLAECLEGLGDAANTRAALEVAASFGSDLHFARLAKERLSRLEG